MRSKRKKQEAAAEFLAHVDDARAQLEQARHHFEAANERLEQRAGRNLLAAIGIGLGLGGALILSLTIFRVGFLIFAGIAIGFACVEFAAALRVKGYSVPIAGSAVAGCLPPVAAFFGGIWWLWASVFVALAVIAAWSAIEQAIRQRPLRSRDLAVSFFSISYIAVLTSFAPLLASRTNGQWWVLAFIVLVAANDTGAYASGVLFGKHPMAPRISPKKTWEGLAGAAVTALVAGVLLAIFMIRIEWWIGLVLGAVMVVTATFGDLLESVIKRDLGIKDMSSWIPGHGGVLDRLDSLLISAPVAYLIAVLVS